MLSRIFRIQMMSFFQQPASILSYLFSFIKTKNSTKKIAFYNCKSVNANAYCFDLAALTSIFRHVLTLSCGRTASAARVFLWVFAANIVANHK